MTLSDIQSQAGQVLLQTWQALFDEHGVPPRTAFKPMKIAKVLNELVRARRSGDDIVVKLAGKKVEWDGRALKELPKNTANFGEIAEELVRFYAIAAETARPVCFTGLGDTGRKKGFRFEQLIVPFKGAGGDISDFVSVVSYEFLNKLQT